MKIGILSLTTLVLLTLKLCEIIDWGWGWIFSPLIFNCILLLLVIIILMLKEINKEKKRY